MGYHRCTYNMEDTTHEGSWQVDGEDGIHDSPFENQLHLYSFLDVTCIRQRQSPVLDDILGKKIFCEKMISCNVAMVEPFLPE